MLASDRDDSCFTAKFCLRFRQYLLHGGAACEHLQETCIAGNSKQSRLPVFQLLYIQLQQLFFF